MEDHKTGFINFQAVNVSDELTFQFYVPEELELSTDEYESLRLYIYFETLDMNIEEDEWFNCLMSRNVSGKTTFARFESGYCGGING